METRSDAELGLIAKSISDQYGIALEETPFTLDVDMIDRSHNEGWPSEYVRFFFDAALPKPSTRTAWAASNDSVGMIYTLGENEGDPDLWETLAVRTPTIGVYATWHHESTGLLSVVDPRASDILACIRLWDTGTSMHPAGPIVAGERAFNDATQIALPLEQLLGLKEFLIETQSA